jgi:hypothetical protein
MSTASRRINPLLVVALVLTMAASQSRAWNPPDGTAVDLADKPPPTSTTLLPKAHGYIIQNGISILYNDGYWFAAQMLRQWQQELANGVRYADRYLGDQVVKANFCTWVVRFVSSVCTNVDNIPFVGPYTRSWPLAADNHYFNPDTGRGLDTRNVQNQALSELQLPDTLVNFITVGQAYLEIEVEPPIRDDYTSALQMFDEEYAHALDAYFESSALSCGLCVGGIYSQERCFGVHLLLCQDVRGRQGTALAMFYLGWASHLMQDQTVVHHTFDEPQKHHTEYENAADGQGRSPIGVGEQEGIYEAHLAQLARDKQVPCQLGSRTCFAMYAAYKSHDASILAAADDADYSNVQSAIYSNVQSAILFAQSLQAGLYAAFLTDIGLRPVHMSAVIAAL